jgi:flagellin-like protein
MVSKKGEAGIGTLILFIALILVAAVAAGVLIQTSNTLQSKALSTGSKAKTQVSTAAQFTTVFAEDAGSDSDLDYFFAEIKLAPGSDPIKLDDTLVEFILKDNSSDLSYNSETTCNTAGASGAGTSAFNVEYLINASQHRAGYIQTGDVIKLCFQGIREVDEDEDVKISFIPKTGSIAQITMSTPETITSSKVYLFP